jgi:hypothetical protein
MGPVVGVMSKEWDSHKRFRAPRYIYMSQNASALCQLLLVELYKVLCDFITTAASF